MYEARILYDFLAQTNISTNRENFYWILKYGQVISSLSRLHFRLLQYFCGQNFFQWMCVRVYVCMCQLVIFDEGSRMHVIIRVRLSVYIHGKCSTMRKKVFLSLFFSLTLEKGCREAFIMLKWRWRGSWVLTNDGMEKNWMNYFIWKCIFSVEMKFSNNFLRGFGMFLLLNIPWKFNYL